MSKKLIVLKLMFMASVFAFGQQQKIIKVIVPNKTDEVYITGNQKSLGNWVPDKIKMRKISDYERSISVDLTYPAEFKFTRGDWNSEGIINQLDNNPNEKLESPDSKNIFTVKGWSNENDGKALGLDYDLEFLPSKFVKKGRQIKIALPENYDPKKKYPVFYITDGASRNFDVAKDYIKSFAGEPFEIIPESILVGIVHGREGDDSNRNKDLDVHYKTNGQAFKNFLFNELVPHINEKYSTAGFNVMIGHSNGAEYNHYLFLEKENPFRGFISISTNFFGKKVHKEMGDMIKKYEGNGFFYFVANAKNDSRDRIEAGDDYERIYKENANPKIRFQKNFYIRNHNSIVPPALHDGIKFIFKDYKRLENYKTFYSYKNHYKVDMRELYGIDVDYSLNDLENALSHIFESKNVKELDMYLDFVKEHKLWKNFFMKEAGGMDAMNQGNFYYHIGAFEKSSQSYAEALNQLEITVEPMVYFSNFNNVVKSFKELKQYKKLMDVLVKSRTFASNHKIYTNGNTYTLLKLNYLIAKLSAEHNIDRRIGRKAKQYCVDNYLKNRLFKLSEIKQLKI